MFTPSFSHESGKARERELERRVERRRVVEEAFDPAERRPQDSRPSVAYLQRSDRAASRPHPFLQLVTGLLHLPVRLLSLVLFRRSRQSESQSA